MDAGATAEAFAGAYHFAFAERTFLYAEVPYFRLSMGARPTPSLYVYCYDTGPRRTKAISPSQHDGLLRLAASSATFL